MLPVRAFHAGLGIARRVLDPALGPVFRWAGDPVRRVWATPLLWSAALSALVFPFDAWLSGGVRSVELGGDVRRELMMLQQFGGVSSIVLIGVLVWLLDGSRRRVLPRMGIALAATWGVVQALKMLIGRPRPKFDDPGVVLGPLGGYPIGDGEGVQHAWEFWAGISSDLWSMPSSHTSGAAALAVAVWSVYPKLRGVGMVMIALVALSRVVFGAHYPSDVVLGAGVGIAVSGFVMRGSKAGNG